jgi:hypothetical protein
MAIRLSPFVFQLFLFSLADRPESELGESNRHPQG